MGRNEKWVVHIKCECGYNNHPDNVKYYGTCTRCGKVVDAQAYFRHVMYNKLRLWRGKRWTPARND